MKPEVRATNLMWQVFLMITGASIFSGCADWKCRLGSGASCAVLGEKSLSQGTEASLREGIDYLEKACENGNASGCAKLGALFLMGGEEEDRALHDAGAAACLQKACDAGGGCGLLGDLYLDGRGVEKDRARGALLIQKACTAGDTDACGVQKIPDDVQDIMQNADHFELLSLHPVLLGKRPRDLLWDFYDWRILGRATVKDAGVRKKLIAAFKEGVEDAHGLPYRCFNPRHGIRVTRNGRTADFVICFECRQVRVFVDNEFRTDFLIRDSPKKVFDSTLIEAMIPLAESRDEKKKRD